METCRSLGAAFIAVAIGLGRPTAGDAQAPVNADTAVRVTFGGYVDAYYAWDFGRPPSFDRSFAGGTLFTTQPARHNEFNVNLAFIEAKVDGPTVRGRIALQAGTSVQSNYLGERTIGRVQGPSLAQHIQEAVAGFRIGNSVWIDGGIFFSNLGVEGWISRDNPQLSRSLVADYSPYYSSGAKLTWTASARLTARLDVVNGWQNISENNSGKGVGVRLDLTPSASTTLSYYNLFSDEAGNRLRTFNGAGARLTAGRATVQGELDIGTQGKSAADGGTATWYGTVLALRWQVATQVWVVGRVEGFDDKDQVIIGTGVNADSVPNGPLRATGGSIGLDIAPQGRVLWRTEVRGFNNKTAIFPDGASGAPMKTDAFVVSSIALTF
jgi:hypothetical protein